MKIYRLERISWKRSNFSTDFGFRITLSSNRTRAWSVHHPVPRSPKGITSFPGGYRPGRRCNSVYIICNRTLPFKWRALVANERDHRRVVPRVCFLGKSDETTRTVRPRDDLRKARSVFGVGSVLEPARPVTGRPEKKTENGVVTRKKNETENCVARSVFSGLHRRSGVPEGSDEHRRRDARRRGGWKERVAAPAGVESKKLKFARSGVCV